jgi:hypothetical protein
MLIRVVGAAALCLAAIPAWAQAPAEVSGPRTLTPAMVLCTDLPTATKPVPRLTVKGPHVTDGHSVATSGMLVVSRQPDDGLAVGQRYVSARIRGDVRKFPRPGEGFGDVRVSGVMTVRALDEVNALAEVDFACDSIEPGDFLEPYVETVLPAAAAPVVPPDFGDRANILFGVDNRVLFGDGDVMSIDRGTLHGAVPGARYALYRDRRDGMPLIYMGEAVVLVTAEQTSKVMITRAVDGVEVGDVAVPRRQP